MSIPILRQVEVKTQARGFTFAVIKQLAYHHNDQYGYAFPKLAYLAKYSRVSVRTIQRHLAKLERMGEVIIERVRGRGRNNRYYLKVLGILPDPTKKHDRASRQRWLKAILQAKAEASSDVPGKKPDKVTSPNKDERLNQTVSLPMAADDEKTPRARCVGYPLEKGEMRYCGFHGHTHFGV
jgi:hypothetical protein